MQISAQISLSSSDANSNSSPENINASHQNVLPPLRMELVDNNVENSPDYAIRRTEWARRFERESSTDTEEEESQVVRSPVNPRQQTQSPPHVTIIREAHSTTDSDSENAPQRGQAFTVLEDSSSSSSDDENVPLFGRVSSRDISSPNSSQPPGQNKSYTQIELSDSDKNSLRESILKAHFQDEEEKHSKKKEMKLLSSKTTFSNQQHTTK